MSDMDMTPNERIQARHWLVEAQERCVSLRNAMDPQHGVVRARWSAFREDIRLLTTPLLRFAMPRKDDRVSVEFQLREWLTIALASGITPKRIQELMGEAYKDLQAKPGDPLKVSRP